MAPKIKFQRLPTQAQPGKPEFALDSSESFLFDMVAEEHTSIPGTTIEYFSLDKKGSTKDPLYSEAEEREFRGPYALKAHVTYPERGLLAQADGLIARWDCTAWIARKSFETAQCPIPHAGDVIRIWNTPFFNKEGVINESVPDSGLFFNILIVHHDGHLFDTPEFVGFKLTLRRRTDFTPERRITNT